MKGDTKGVQVDAKALMSRVPGLTEKQCSYLNYFLTGLSKSEAATLSGYSSASAMAVHRSAAVQAALALVMERYLTGELAPLAMNTITRLLQDDKTAGGVKATLALGVLDRAGFSAKRKEQAPQGKDAAQMTRDELQAEIDRLAREIDSRMVDVTPDPGDGEPNSEPITAQDIELYE